VDRYYIEQFLQSYCRDIHGKVLEVGGSTYTDRFGANVEQCAVLDNNPANPKATIQADLESTIDVGNNEFDCLIFTQVLQYIYNLQGCIQELHRILKPGGVLLLTVPCVSRIDLSYGGDFWRFTTSSSEMLFSEIFGKNHVIVQPFGNVLSSIAFLTGAAYEELSKKELDYQDPSFQLLLGVRAIKK
jgi:SAM-dependent methyltransferase